MEPKKKNKVEKQRQFEILNTTNIETWGFLFEVEKKKRIAKGVK